jgi:hypothetical protein
MAIEEGRSGMAAVPNQLGLLSFVFACAAPMIAAVVLCHTYDWCCQQR